MRMTTKPDEMRAHYQEKGQLSAGFLHNAEGTWSFIVYSRFSTATRHRKKGRLDGRKQETVTQLRALSTTHLPKENDTPSLDHGARCQEYT